MALGDGVSAIAMLGVTFGGFSPTAMDGVEASKEWVERAEETAKRKKEADKRRREIEMARTSAKRRFTDEFGMTWTYVVLDNAYIRLVNCTNEVERAIIPEAIEDLPVRALGSDLFHKSDVVKEIVCPAGVESIGASAFRILGNLKRVVFPESTANYSRSWLQQCPQVEEITLPGMLDILTSDVFEFQNLKRLYLGKSLYGVKPGACEKTRLETLVIDSENPFIMTDGDAIYSIDGTVLIALARPVESYVVRPGCTALAKKAFMGIRTLTDVQLPESLRDMGEFAFAHTGLRRVTVPASVAVVQSKVFYHCSDLEEVELNEGLVELSDSAFAESGLKSIYIPASIERIGTSVTADTNIVYAGEGATYRISPDSKSLFYDGMGGLYRREEDGIHFVQLIDREVSRYSVFEGTRFIDGHAFAFHSNIEEVVLPEGVVEIGKSAFRICGNLRSVAVPESLKSIGKEAFLDTVIESLYLPAGFEDLSEDALVTKGAHRLGDPPSLQRITVHEDNPTYYVESGLLCRRGDRGDRGIVFAGNVADVVIPDAVTSIADLAFSNARGIETFSVGPNLATIGTGGFSTWSYIKSIHVELAKPVEGRTIFDVRFPDTPRTIHEISISLGGSAWVNVPEIMKHYDNCIAHAHDYNVSDNATSAYDQVKLMLSRFKDPILLTAVNRSLFERIIRENLEGICVDIARHDDRSTIDDLCDFKFLNSDNLEDVIVAVGRLQDAAMTGYLLELKRRRFGRAVFDFDL